MIKAIFFDFYNTIARFDPPRETLQLSLCKEFDMNVTYAGIRKGYAHADRYMAREIAKLPLNKRNDQQIKEFFGEYQRLVLLGSGIDVGSELAYTMFSELSNMDYGFGLFEDVMPTMDSLKSKGISMGIISNYDGNMKDVCRDLGLSTFLSFIITAEETGIAKPHPGIFIEALKRMNIEARHSMHVGDQYDTDIIGATRAHINPVLIDRDGYSQHLTAVNQIASLTELIQLISEWE